MRLDQIDFSKLDDINRVFSQNLSPYPLAGNIFARIMDSRSGFETEPDDRTDWVKDAIKLAHDMSIDTLDEEPAKHLSWDGKVLRSRSESWVILHEIAHWQLCPPNNRHLPDFGLGAGPESGNKDLADNNIAIHGDPRMREEALASLLGVLWGCELSHPAFFAFWEQNWLEGYQRQSTADYFAEIVENLVTRQAIDKETARPIPSSRAD